MKRVHFTCFSLIGILSADLLTPEIHSNESFVVGGLVLVCLLVIFAVYFDDVIFLVGAKTTI